MTIQQALAEDLATFDEIDERFARVYGASTQAELREVVADGVRVQAQASSLIGNTKKGLSPALPEHPTVRIKGVQVFGDVSIYSLSQVPEGALRRLWASLRGRSVDS